MNPEEPRRFEVEKDPVPVHETSKADVARQHFEEPPHETAERNEANSESFEPHGVDEAQPVTHRESISFDYGRPTAEAVKPEGLAQVLQRDRLKVLTSNVRHILGPEASDSDVASLAKKTFSEYVKAILFSLRPRSRKELVEQTDAYGMEHLRNALDTHGRAVFVTSHMSYFPTGMKMIPGLLPERTRGTALIEKNPVWPVINALKKLGFAFRGKKAEGARFDMMIKEQNSFAVLREIVSRLSAGRPDGQREVFFIAGDRGDLSPDRKRTKVDFLNAQVHFPTGPATMARLTNAPLLPGYIVRKGERFAMRIGTPLDVGGEDEEQAIQQATQAYADVFAEGIREFPEQWPMYRHDYWPEQRDFRP